MEFVEWINDFCIDKVNRYQYELAIHVKSLISSDNHLDFIVSDVRLRVQSTDIVKRFMIGGCGI